SAERTRGTVSKLLAGGGGGGDHPRGVAFHGAGPAPTPRLRVRTEVTIPTSTPAAGGEGPNRRGRVLGGRGARFSYSSAGLGMPSRPMTCWIRKVTRMPMKINQKLSLPQLSLSIRPVILGNQ